MTSAPLHVQQWIEWIDKEMRNDRPYSRSWWMNMELLDWYVKAKISLEAR